MGVMRWDGVIRGDLCALLALVAVAVGCDSKVSGVQPVGGDQASPIEQERFLGRLHLDLTGARAADQWMEDSLARLATDGDSAQTRSVIAAPLVDSDEWAAQYVDELENRLYGGEDAEARYEQLCGILRAVDPTCTACAPPTGGDVCAECSCAPLVAIVADRDSVRQVKSSLATSATTADVGRALAASQALTDLSDPDTTVMALFETFVGRAAEAEEQLNGRNMVFGISLAGSPSGLLFHRHGTDYDDLVDIIFESEVYREAQVAQVFDRYLGRSPTPAELRHFAAQLDTTDPDVRPTVRAVVSSREYFEQ